MSKSNIALAIIAGAVIGGAVALVLQAQHLLDPEEAEDEPQKEPSALDEFGNIARQFSERISSELKAAENKIKSAVKKDPDFTIPQGEFGVFL